MFGDMVEIRPDEWSKVCWGYTMQSSHMRHHEPEDGEADIAKPSRC